MICKTIVKHPIGILFPLLTHGKECTCVVHGRSQLPDGKYRYMIKECPATVS